jgi:hypothetical protein
MSLRSGAPIGVRCVMPGLAAVALIWAAAFVAAPTAPEAAAPAPAPQAGAPPATEAEARIACGTACHRFPPPDILPRAVWRDELVRMQLIMDGVPEPAGSMSRAAMMIPLPPDMLRLLRYYEANAPEALADPEPWPALDAGPVRFTQSLIPLAGMAGRGNFALAHVRFLDLAGDGTTQLVASDMRAGLVVAGPPGGPLQLVTDDIPHPSRIHQVDLDGDGLQDLLVSDLGSFQPADHEAGSIYWLRRGKDGQYTTVRLASGLGRVADARAADVDGDGDLDIVAAVFGWRRTGSLVLFENRTTNWNTPVFVPRVLDARTGALDVPIADLNGDGHPDIVALFAQEHESVVAFLNDGTGAFTATTIFTAPHPNWGSSGIELVDMTGNGRLDVLHTHGDTFDDFVLKPYHGITLLENRGTFPFVERPVAALPGAHRAMAIDVNGNGRLDIVAAAMVAGGGGAREDQLAAVVWLEQLPSGEFARHAIKTGSPYHATLDAWRDAKGTLHIAAGAFAFGKPLDGPVYLWTSR